MGQISYSCERYGCYEVYKVDDESQTQFIQSDLDYPSLANTFGWIACQCGHTDGTVDCQHKTASAMIQEAGEYLDSHEGMIIENSDYFE